MSKESRFSQSQREEELSLVEKAAIVDLLALVPVARWLYGQRGCEAEVHDIAKGKIAQKPETCNHFSA